MKFYEWITDYQLYKKQVPKARQDEYPIFYQQRCQQLVQAGAIPIRLMAEHQWRKINHPYYNIHPNLTAKLCRVDLNKIPSNMLQMPHDLPVVNIRFAQQHQEFTVLEALVTENRSTTGSAIGIMPPGSFCHGILMFDNRELLEPRFPPLVFFVMDFNVYTPHQQPVYTILGIEPSADKSLEDAMKEQVKNRYQHSYNEMLKNIMRLAVTIGFLSNNPAICEPDVLAKDRDEFYRTTDELRKTIMISRARRKGKLGYNVGNDMMFLGERPVQDRKESAATGRELEWAHIRSGHPHAVRYGPGKKLVKIMWFKPTTVREDLPFKPS